MSRKHFELVARILNNQRPLNSEQRKIRLYWTGIVRQFASEFKLTNSRFDRDKFFAACGGLYL